MVNMVIRNLKDRIERKKHDVGIDSLQNKVDLGGNNVRRRERYVSPIVDDDFNKMGDENYNNASLGHEDQFGHPRNHKYRFDQQALRLIKYAVAKTGGEFRKEMQRRASVNNNKPAAPAENLHKRMQGFGNTSFEMPSEDRKSFAGEE
ncbi:hypothetical protein POTOM_011553 [Populus tomentosa]|uniref:Uncharacterized protein n=1 Tax=Populus tomentosa TaxID=118781 RepID=A0A8X8A923_POPTO|nr:hypothetical protein POTOM_011553 [Populus tomentosa]